MKKCFKVMTMVFVFAFMLAFAKPVLGNAENTSSLNGMVVTTKATKTSTTIQWATVTDAVQYKIMYADISKIQYNADGSVTGETSTVIVNGDTTSYTFKNLGKANYIVGVAPINAANEVGGYGNTNVTPKTPKVGRFSYELESLANLKYKMTIDWNAVLAEGYQVQLVSVKGKVLAKADLTSTQYTTDTSGVKYFSQNFSNIGRSAAGYVRIRAYNTYTGGENKGKKYYSAWSKVTKSTLFVPQPVTSAPKSGIKKNSATIKWKKVKGATSYTIYVRKKKSNEVYGKNYKVKKVATTKKTSYTLTKFKGKTINTLGNGYVIYVVTNAKVKKKKASSARQYGTNVYTYRIYR